MADWTPSVVEGRLESAADVVRSLPEVKPQGYFNAWPEYDHGFADLLGVATKPFVATHSNARALCSHKRNLSLKPSKSLPPSNPQCSPLPPTINNHQGMDYAIA